MREIIFETSTDSQEGDFVRAPEDFVPHVPHHVSTPVEGGRARGVVIVFSTCIPNLVEVI